MDCRKYIILLQVSVDFRFTHGTESFTHATFLVQNSCFLQLVSNLMRAERVNKNS